MAIQVNNYLLASIIFQNVYPSLSYAYGSYSGPVFCDGAMPTDAQVDTITGINHTLISTASCGSITNYANGAKFASTSGVPPQWYWSTLGTKTFTATKTANIGWAALYNCDTSCIVLVDVGLAGSGAVITVDKTAVSSGTVVTLLGVSAKLWR